MKWKERPSESFAIRDSHGEELRSLLFISVFSNDKTTFSILLTRVPCVGEIIANEGALFKVVRVEHCAMSPTGKSRVGFAAILDVELIPDEPAIPRRKRGDTQQPAE